ncbi:cytochrome P450 [Triangularia verruculosa]|uniref:Cytochrome P450 n=1 Tax=Triangularia verruculosa TaxID=2587418 RepID=A0AAN7ATT2_9PEZI|nr:cytochrome P450 [Triangularia verruculosa]
MILQAAAIFFGWMYLVVLTYRSWVRHQKVPGPFFAAISNIPRLRWTWSGAAHQVHMQLHDRYGSLVRLGPNCISVGDPKEIQKIYGTTVNLKKSDFYKVMQPMSRGKVVQGLFNTQDDELHRAMKRPIANIYSMSNLMEFEPHVDTTIRFFLSKLDAGTTEHDQTVDLGTWLQWFAFDMMGEITFSKRLGFLDESRDVDGIMGSIQKVFRYASSVGQIPWLDKLWAKNPLLCCLPEGSSPIVAFALARARERSNISEVEKTTTHHNTKNFMSRFLEAKAKHPEIPDWFVTAWATSNVLAGSDTTAIMMRAIVYFLIKNPDKLGKLMEELSLAHVEGRLSDIVTWKESRSLPYLDACVKEAGRLHPVIGLPLERVVPKGGVELCGQRFEEGTIVGMNPWVVHRDKETFGQDLDEFVPERWLCDRERRVGMERCLLTFGAGRRTCLGKNISYLEICKLIPTLFWRYKMALEGDWKVVNHWMVAQTGLNVRMTPRGRNQGVAAS